MTGNNQTESQKEIGVTKKPSLTIDLEPEFKGGSIQKFIRLTDITVMLTELYSTSDMDN